MRRNQRNRKRKNFREEKFKKILEIIIFILILLVLILIFKNLHKSNNYNENKNLNNNSQTNEQEIIENNVETTENEENTPINFTLTAIGDTLCHNTQYWDAYNSATKEYDFSYVYEDIKYYTSSSDITIGSLETTFAGEDKGYSNYPTFNSPDSLASGLKDIGVDVISLAGNHALDYGYSGLCRTIDVLDKFGISHLGTYKTAEEQEQLLIKDVKGVKAKPDKPDNFIPLSCVPWLSFSACSYDTYSPSPMLFPVIVFGKYFKQNNETFLPFTIFATHAVCDGYHVCLLINTIEELCKNCNEFIK